MNARLLVLLGFAFLIASCKRIEKWERDADERAAAAPRPPARVVPVPQGRGLPAGTYRIVDVRVEAEPLDRGRPWDDPKTSDGAAPDLTIEIRADGRKLDTCRGPDNSTTARCRLSLDFELDAATQLELVVEDRDTFVNDIVGHARLVDPAHWDTGLVMEMPTSGGLRAATIVLERTPTWWEVHGIRVLGGLAGIAVGLGALAVFRRRLFAPPPATPRAQLAILDEPLLLVAAGAGLLEVLAAGILELDGLPPAMFALVFALGGAGLTLTVAHVVHARHLAKRDVGVATILVAALALGFVIKLAKIVAMCAIAIGVLAIV